jgi:hypothetical protein
MSATVSRNINTLLLDGMNYIGGIRERWPKRALAIVCPAF